MFPSTAQKLLTKTAYRALTNATDYPIGSRCWDVHSPVFNGGVELNMNACDDEKEYNCADGCCVAIEERCNGKNDCPDGSDEQARSNGLGQAFSLQDKSGGNVKNFINKDFRGRIPCYTIITINMLMSNIVNFPPLLFSTAKSNPKATSPSRQLMVNFIIM